MGINLGTKLTPDQIAAFKYALITSCEVEKTFSSINLCLIRENIMLYLKTSQSY